MGGNTGKLAWQELSVLPTIDDRHEDGHVVLYNVFSIEIQIHLQTTYLPSLSSLKLFLTCG